MIRSIVRAVTLGAAALGAVGLTSAAFATVYTYDFTNKGNSELSSQVFGANGGGLNVKVTAWHANDSNPSASSIDTISSATLGIYSGGGLGDVFGNDTSSNGTHQIDNVGGGVDFLMLQFDKDVSLSGIARNVYSMSGAGVGCCDSDAAIWGDTGKILGNATASSSINLAQYRVDESIFTTVDGGTTGLSTKSASVWLVSAAFNQSNDGFKLAGLTVMTPNNPTPAVPEPASWALMIVGFGAIGVGMRRRKAAIPATA